MQIREFTTADTSSWVRCRALAFLATQYYDDVHPSPDLPDEVVQRLVAVESDEVVGLIDVTIEGAAATIDSIAVHPDHQRRGIGAALLRAALAQLPSPVETLDAWTRDDPGTNAWYLSQGFTENYRYLHVYAYGDAVPDRRTPTGTLVMAHYHAPIEREAEMRARFERVYICRQYLMSVGTRRSE